MKYYVYGYFREDGTPYYIGKGKGRRAWNSHKRNMLPGDRSRIKILLDGMTEEEALEAERDLISLLGRKDLGSGCLRNLTDGGEGTSGRSHVTSVEHREKLSVAAKGKPKTEAHRRAIGMSLKGKPKSFSHRMNLRKVGAVDRCWIHEIHGVVTCSAADLARNHGLHTGALSRVARGYAIQHKGWRLG